jgi:CRISPR-associated protein Csb2
VIVELSFLTGRFHATPWGRHVNEGVPEWPPSPFRLARALIDVWYRKRQDLPADDVERLLRQLSTPPVYSLPPARAHHTRSYLAQNSDDPSDKKLVFDGFAVVDREDSVLVGWPDLVLDGRDQVVAQALWSSLNYLGRSESWVEARVADVSMPRWNCTPVAAGAVPEGKEVVSVAGILDPDTFDSAGLAVPGKGKTKPRNVPWFEALTWGSAETIAATMNRPPAMEPIFYLRDVDALDARPISIGSGTHRPTVEAVRFAIEGKVKVPITEALRVAEGVRRNLMGSLRRILKSDHLPVTFTGKDAEGCPAQGHRHISILPLDDDGDGFIDALVITSPSPLSLEEQRALDGIHPINQRSGHPLVLTPLRLGPRDEILQRSKCVVSHTPFAPTRHRRVGRDNDENVWLAAQVTLECERRGLPRPVRVDRVENPSSGRRRVRWLDFRRARKDDAPRPAYGLKVEFAEAVRAPFSLGYGSHFGLGCFCVVK